MTTIESTTWLVRRCALAALCLSPLLANGCAEDAAAPFELDYYVYQDDAAATGRVGAPIAGVLVALDLPSGRQDLTTDAAGRVHLSIPADAPDFTLTAAKAGWLPVATLYRVTVAEARARIAQDGKLFSVLSPPPSPDAGAVTITVSSTSPLCVSIGPWSWCSIGGAAEPRVRRSAEPLTFVAYSFDFDGCPQRLTEITVPNTLTDQSVTVDFATADATPPMRANASLRLPTDPASFLRSVGPGIWGSFPVWAVGDHAGWRVRGGACAEELSTDGGMLDVSVRWFPLAAGPQAFFFMVFPELPGDKNGDEMEFSWIGPVAELGSSPYDVLDIPRVTTNGGAAPTLASTYETQEVATASTYDLLVHDGHRHEVVLWTARSFRHQPITLPALPAGYDRSAEWPADGQLALRVEVTQGPFPHYAPSFVGPETRGAKSALVSATFE